MNRFNKFAVGAVVGLIVLIASVIWWILLDKTEITPSEVAPSELVDDEVGPIKEIIGYSVEERQIEVFYFGEGEAKLLFVGGVHGGYEWNSVDLAYQLMNFLEANPEFIPKGVRVAIIPNLNPDGLFKVVGKVGWVSKSDIDALPDRTDFAVGRFNANGVDLNRNFDCKWQPESTWRGKTVSAGTYAFSEPEAMTLRNFVLKFNPEAVVFWHSQANAVYASECFNGILPATLSLMNTYASSANYQAIATFDAYPVSGDAEGWLASIGIPAITVELETHESTDWERNLAGVKAVFKSEFGNVRE